MGITVDDILQLDLLKEAELVAGKTGLTREVMRVNFTDSPLDQVDPGYNLVSRGDLYIHSFYADMDDESHIYNLINFYIQTGSCCCIGVKYHLTSLPERVLRLADQEKYPIIMADSDMPYGRLIKDISELILTEQLDLHSENKINRLLYDNLTASEQNELAQYLAPNLPHSFCCLYVTYPDLPPLRFKLLKKELSERFRLHYLRYQRGGFILLDAAEKPAFSPGVDSIMQLFERYGKTFGSGVSSHFSRAANLAAAFREAMAAHEISSLTGSKPACYDDASLYMLLLPLRDQPALQKFVRDTLGPLKEYGEHHFIDLLETIRVYFETNGNNKETALRMNTHENTIRFRIGKARSLLGLETEPYLFIERVSLALKAERLLRE